MQPSISRLLESLLPVVASLHLGLHAPPLIAADDLINARLKLNRQHAERLTDLSEKLKNQGNLEAARAIRNWLIPRDDKRQYVFHDPHHDGRSGATTYVGRGKKWGEEFRKLRHDHAEQLWALARAAANRRDMELSFSLLWETLRENPSHRSARQTLGNLDRSLLRVTSDRPILKTARSPLPELGWRRFWIVDTPNFRIATNHSPAAGIELAKQLQHLYSIWRQVFVRFWIGENAFNQAWQGEATAQRNRTRHVVILFRNRDEYIRHLSQVEPQIGITLGIYRHIDRKSYFYASNEDLSSTWRHEATHQLLHETLRAPDDVGEQRNFWILEGIALYMESLQDFDDYSTLGGFEANRLQYARYRAFNERFYVPLRQLVTMGRERLQSDSRIRRLYSQSAGLTHFFMTNGGGHMRTGTIQYLHQIYRKQDDLDSLANAVDNSLDDLDREYHDFLQIADDDVELLQHTNRKVANLALGHTRISDVSLEAIGRLENVRWLDLSHCDVTDQGIRHLANLPMMERLNLEYTSMSNEGLRSLGNLTQLKELDLSGTNLTDDGLVHLLAMKKLRVLWLTNTKITDDGLLELIPLRSLNQLDVQGTQVSSAGLIELARQLPNLKLQD